MLANGLHCLRLVRLSGAEGLVRKLAGDRPVLAQRQDGYCVFWEQLCTIHPIKPLMCRKWPFLESILVDPVNWLTMANSCPGIQTDVDIEDLKKFVRHMIKII